jgi:hypothetical protein
MFNLLSKGKPIIDYENFHPLYEFFENLISPQKHWFDGASWEITGYI